ncbi:hypothetical protein ACLOJK_007447, partial [Asimina triloba]
YRATQLVEPQYPQEVRWCMPSRRRGVTELVLFDLEPERNLHQRRRDRLRESEATEAMEATDGNQAPGLLKPRYDNDRAIHEFIAPGLDCIHSSIRRPSIEANNFELKSI